jgi:membrane-associated phospholipid phosphatase
VALPRKKRLMNHFGLRRAEWILVTFFAYIALLSPFFRDRLNMGLQPLLLLLAALTLFGLLGRSAKVSLEFVRDWLPLLLTLAAFREMELFLTPNYNVVYEKAWIQLDRFVLDTWHVTAAIENLGRGLPLYLEICYLLVYGVAAYCIVVLTLDVTPNGKVDHVSIDRFWVVYLLGTLGAYALFPFFPSQPPRFTFPEVAPPTVVTWARNFNLWILSRATIHSGVFPSAHVSSAFSCAWGMFLVRPRRRLLNWILLIYACSVSIATIYGRYHYTADVLAGFAVSLVAGCVARFFLKAKVA